MITNSRKAVFYSLAPLKTSFHKETGGKNMMMRSASSGNHGVAGFPIAGITLVIPLQGSR
jgi:hypothetical protein